MSSITIVGAGGFVGSNLIESLVLDGDSDVRAVIRSYRSLAGFCQFGDAVDVRIADAEDTSLLSSAFEGSATVVNLTTGAPASIVRSTQAIHKACSISGVKRLVHLSSAVVFGDVVEPYGDDDPPVSRHWMPYARAKAASENWLRQRAHDSKLEVVVLRPGIVWGVRSPHTLAIAKALTSKKAYLVGDGEGIFNGIYIDNLSSCIRVCCERRGAAEGFYNVGDSEVVTWRWLFDAIGPALGCDSKKLARVRGTEFPRSIRSLVDDIQSLPLVNGLYHRVKSKIPDALKSMIRTRLEGGYEYERMAASYEAHPVVDRELWHLQRVRHKLSSEKFSKAFEFTPSVSFDEGVSRTIAWLDSLGLVQRCTLSRSLNSGDSCQSQNE